MSYKVYRSSAHIYIWSPWAALWLTETTRTHGVTLITFSCCNKHILNHVLIIEGYFHYIPTTESLYLIWLGLRRIKLVWKQWRRKGSAVGGAPKILGDPGRYWAQSDGCPPTVRLGGPVPPRPPQFRRLCLKDNKDAEDVLCIMCLYRGYRCHLVLNGCGIHSTIKFVAHNYMFWCFVYIHIKMCDLCVTDKLAIYIYIYICT